MKENEEIKKANEEYEYLTGDAAERRVAFLIDKAIRDEKSMVEGARDEGIEKGAKQEKLAIAKKLLLEKIPTEQIIRITGLSLEEIQKLNKN